MSDATMVGWYKEMSLKIQIGAGLRPIKGFINYDLNPAGRVLYGVADKINHFDDSVNLLFSNAVFEHLNPTSYPSVFTEWERVLSDDGMIVALGIPDFKTIVLTYLSGGLNLQQVYNYVVGEITETSSVETCIGQIHKDLFTKESLERTFLSEGLKVVSFRYCYPGETHKVNLGVIATTKREINLEDLKLIDSIEQFIDLSTIET